MHQCFRSALCYRGRTRSTFHLGIEDELKGGNLERPEDSVQVHRQTVCSLVELLYNVWLMKRWWGIRVVE